MEKVRKAKQGKVKEKWLLYLYAFVGKMGLNDRIELLQTY